MNYTIGTLHLLHDPDLVVYVETMDTEGYNRTYQNRTYWESSSSTSPVSTNIPGGLSTFASSHPITASGNVSEIDLKTLNDKKAEALLPAMLVLGFFMLIGIVGNSLVCYIMGFKLKSNTQNLLIVYLAIFDLINCLVCMPADIHDMRFYYYFPSEIACKIVRAIMSFTSFSSIFTLVVIAVDRYRKICKPLNVQMTQAHAKRCMILVLFVAVLFAWPTLIIFGFRDIETGVPGIQGHDCSISRTLKGTIYPMLFTSFLFLCFIFLCVSLIVIYSCILVALRRHRKLVASDLYPNHFTLKSAGPCAKDTIQPAICSTTITTDQSPSNTSDTIDLDEPPKVESSLNGGKETSNLSSTAHVGRATVLSKEITCSSTLSTTDSNPDDNKECNGGDGSKNVREPFLLNGTHLKDCDQTQFNDGAGINKNSLNNTANSITIIVTEEDGGIVSSSTDVYPMCDVANIHSKQNNTGLQHHEYSSCNESDRYKTTIDHNVISSESFRIQAALCQGNRVSKVNHKTTLIAFLVTLVFILSYVPYLSLQISKQIVEGLDYNLGGASLVFYNIFLRSYHINSITNPIIYGILNRRFRHRVTVLWSGLIESFCIN